MKILLYCTKSKPYLNDCKLINPNKRYFISNKGIWSIDLSTQQTYSILNGKIVAECEYEVEEIKQNVSSVVEQWYSKDLLEKSCLDTWQLDDYLCNKSGKAIHIKNLHIFDKPKELKDYSHWKIVNNGNITEYTPIIVNHAPQNMMKVFDNRCIDYILISIRPEWLCKILNGEKTIEVRRKILQVMKNEI